MNEIAAATSQLASWFVKYPAFLNRWWNHILAICLQCLLSIFWPFKSKNAMLSTNQLGTSALFDHRNSHTCLATSPGGPLRIADPEHRLKWDHHGLRFERTQKKKDKEPIFTSRGMLKNFTQRKNPFPAARNSFVERFQALWTSIHPTYP